MSIPYPLPDVPARDLIPRARPTFAQNIRGHAFNALTEALGEDEWMPLSRRLDIANTIGDAILAFLAPLGLDGEQAAGIPGNDSASNAHQSPHTRVTQPK